MRIRLYQSALNDVRYVFGKPLRFSADQAVRRTREDAKDRALILSRSSDD